MTENATDRIIEIGRLGKAHGLNGAIRVWLYNPDTSLRAGAVIFIGDEREKSPRKVLGLRSAGRFHVLTLEGLAHRDQCELLKNQLVYMRRSDLPALDEDEFYIDDLIRMEVHEAGVVIGTVVSSRAQGDIEILQVECADGVLELPLVDEFIVALDIPGRRVHVQDSRALLKHELKKQKSSLT